MSRDDTQSRGETTRQDSKPLRHIFRKHIILQPFALKGYQYQSGFEDTQVVSRGSVKSSNKRAHILCFLVCRYIVFFYLVSIHTSLVGAETAPTATLGRAS